MKSAPKKFLTADTYTSTLALTGAYKRNCSQKTLDFTNLQGINVLDFKNP
jgi:hypothetical protein